MLQTEPCLSHSSCCGTNGCPEWCSFRQGESVSRIAVRYMVGRENLAKCRNPQVVGIGTQGRVLETANAVGPIRHKALGSVPLILETQHVRHRLATESPVLAYPVRADRRCLCGGTVWFLGPLALTCQRLRSRVARGSHIQGTLPQLPSSSALSSGVDIWYTVLLKTFSLAHGTFTR